VALYAKELTDRMPGNLKVAYFVNSGSEANDSERCLALTSAVSAGAAAAGAGGAAGRSVAPGWGGARRRDARAGADVAGREPPLALTRRRPLPPPPPAVALMMARLFTGNYDVVALRNAYHGLRCRRPPARPPALPASPPTARAR
jgi:hypothetical protein